MMRSTSVRIFSNDSPSSGARLGSCSRIVPGLSLGATRSCSMCSRKSAIQSASSCNCLRNSSGGVSPGAVIRDAGNPACKLSRCKRRLMGRQDCLPHGSPLKRKTETEVERAEIFELVRVRIYTVVEANRADRQLVTQTSTNCITHVVQPNVFGSGQKIAGISKDRALQFAENWERVFNIEDGKKFAADRVTVIIVRTEIALGEAAHGRGTAIEKTFVDGNFSRFVGPAVGKRMDNASTRTERDRRLAEPTL